MVANRIGVKRAEVKITQRALAEKLPDDVNAVAFTFIEGGRVLPTRGGLQAMCDLFGCKPSDLYDPADIDLLSVGHESRDTESGDGDHQKDAQPTKPTADDDSQPAKQRTKREWHEGMEEFRSWMMPDEKAALRKAITALGYRSLSEWLREMYRETIKRYLDMKLQPHGKSLASRALQEQPHGATPPSSRHGCSGSDGISLPDDPSAKPD